MLGFCVSLVSQLIMLSYVYAQDIVPTTSRTGAGCVYSENAPSGTIASPNYPNKYPSSALCKWTIEAPVGSSIELTFDHFLLENSRGCKSDYLLLFDGADTTSRKVGRYCGRSTPTKLTSSNKFIYLEFYSDDSLNFNGFHAMYVRISPPTTKPTIWRSQPKFLYPLTNKTVPEGQSFELNCHVQGSPEPTITWQKDSLNFTENGNIFVQVNTSQSILKINMVSPADSGKYSCQAYNGVGATISMHSWVQVEKRVTPVITMVTENMTIRIGSNVTLVCKGTGPPPLTTRWIENSQVVAENQCARSEECALQFVRRYMKKTFVTCNIRNEAGNVTRNVLIKVTGPPIITNAPQDVKAEVGVLVNFSCEAIGILPVEIRWAKDNENVFSGVTRIGNMSVLSFDAVKNLTVTCIAKDRDGVTEKHAQLNVTEIMLPQPVFPTVLIIPLQFVLTPLDQQVEHNTTAVTLECKARGFPVPRISWIQDGINITTRASVTNGVSTLTLPSRQEGSSTIICVAKNIHEDIQSSAIITYFTETNDSNGKSGSSGDSMKIIVGTVIGILLLVILIAMMVFLVRRWRRRKNVVIRLREHDMEGECLSLNPPCSSSGKTGETTRGIEALHVPQENIFHCGDIDNDIGVRTYLARAKDLPLSKPGEHKVITRALKDTRPSDEIKDEFAMEASSLVNLVHPNIVRLMAVSIKMPPLCLIFECSDYGYLDAYLQSCDPSDSTIARKDSSRNLENVDRISIAKQIAAGMQYLTEKGHMHQELRAHHCMVFNNLQVKVANLGLRWASPPHSFLDMEPTEREQCAVRWLAPEVVMYSSYSVSSDVWSYGVLLWEIFSNGQLPYPGINEVDVVSYVRGGNVLPRPKLCPYEIYEVMKSCCEITPLERPSFKLLHESMTSFHDIVPVLQPELLHAL